MPINITSFLRKNYKIFIVLASLIVFFVVYDTYLVDRSLINLKIALNKAAQAQTLEDFEKIKPLLKIPLLKEISQKALSSKALVYMEIAENIATTAKTVEQIEDVKLYLTALVEAKEKERGGFLSALDHLNSRIFAPIITLSKKELEAKEKNLLSRIGAAKDKNLLQGLYYDLGNIYIQLSDISKAKYVFFKMSQIDSASPLSIKAKFNLAWAYKSTGEFEKAMAYFEEVSREYAKLELSITSQYEITDVWYKKGAYQIARDKYGELAGLYPEFDIADLALYEAGYISFYNLNDTDAALKYFLELEKQFPKSRLIQHIMNQIRPLMATDFCRKGFRLLMKKIYPEAIENFKRAVEIAPSDSRSLSGMGLGFYWTDERQEALNRVKKAVQVTPIDEVSLTNSLFVHINSGQIDEAIKIGEEVLSKIIIKKPEFYYNLGYAYVLKANIHRAVMHLDRAIRLNPDFVFAYNNLGCALWATGKYTEAIRMFKKAIAQEPDYVDAYFNLGIAYLHLKRLEDAYLAFKKVLGIDPDYPQVKDYLARIKEILKYEP